MDSALSVCKSMCVEDSVENNPEAGAKSDVVNVESTTAGADSAKQVTGTSSHVEFAWEEVEENSENDEEVFEDFEHLKWKIDNTIDVTERFTYITKLVKLSISALKEMNYDSSESPKCFNALLFFHEITTSENRKKLYRTMLKRGFMNDICSKFCQKVDETKCYQIEDTLKASHKMLLIIIWRMSDTLDTFCPRLVESGVMAKLIEMFGSPVVHATVTGNNEQQEETAMHMLPILYNVCRQVVVTGQLREKIVELVQKYTNTKEVYVKTLAVLVLSYTIDHDNDDKEKICASKESIDFLKALLEDSVLRPTDHGERFDSSEILEGLNMLAVNNRNSARIVRRGLLPLYVKCLANDDDVVVVKAVKGLWTFSFCEENKKSILEEEGCVDALKRLKNTEISSLISKAAEGALVVLGVVELKRPTGGENKDHDVMISYQWDSWESSVKWIHQQLKRRGFKIWIDRESMGGSTLDSMAEAVENATVVILCITEKYKQSQSCRMEAEHSLKQNKEFIPLKLEHEMPSRGWLGILLGQKTYYDFSEEELREKKIEELCTALGKCVTCPEGVDQVDGPPEKTTPRKLITQEELQKTLCDLGLSLPTIHMFKEFGGEQLEELFNVYENSPTFYYNMMTSQFNMEPLHLLNFTKFLRQGGQFDKKANNS